MGHPCCELHIVPAMEMPRTHHPGLLDQFAASYCSTCHALLFCLFCAGNARFEIGDHMFSFSTITTLGCDSRMSKKSEIIRFGSWVFAAVTVAIGVHLAAKRRDEYYISIYSAKSSIPLNVSNGRCRGLLQLGADLAPLQYRRRMCRSEIHDPGLDSTIKDE